MSGRDFLQIPGPTNIPDRVLRAMDRPVVDHRSPEFAQLTEDVRRGLRRVFGTRDGAPMLKLARERFGLSLCAGIGQLSGQAFRIGHLGSLNELEVLGTIGGTELAFAQMGLDVEIGSGLLACQQVFAQKSVVTRDASALVGV